MTRRQGRLAFVALGIVFGDIGTSPLYALRECFQGPYGVAATHANVLGVLSLVFWALVLVVGLKYLAFMLRADNHGEGGVLALTALATPRRGDRTPARRALLAAGLFGAALLYGDGIITPAVSVLSAVEGLGVVAPQLSHFVVPLSVTILLGVFAFQRHGTSAVGGLFGPVMAVWFAALAVLGAGGISENPSVLAAIAPWHGAHFLAAHGGTGLLVLGGVFLVVTGAEALYADMGHFGKEPIRLAWCGIVFPALVLNYFGQGAILLESPEQAHHPFYALAPQVTRVPLLLLATAATVIASQAVISGAFSLTRQAVQLDYLPRMRIIHTSAEEKGQIYVPPINALLAASTVGVVLFFSSSSRLAAAYGMAVTTTMLISTLLFYVVARDRWRWSRLAAAGPTALFLCADLTFFSANLGKLVHGAWVPLAIAGMIYVVMATWRRGRHLLALHLLETSARSQELVPALLAAPPHRVEGDEVFLSGSEDRVPTAFMHNLKHNKVVHQKVAFVHVRTEEVPSIPREEKIEVIHLGGGFHQVLARYGFMESPNIAHVLALAGEQGLGIDPDQASYFVGRQRVLAGRRPALGRWRTRLFRFLSRNALDATSFYEVPPDRVMEVGAQVRL